MKIKQKEGILEVKEIDVDDFFSSSYQESQKRKGKLYLNPNGAAGVVGGGPNSDKKTILEINKEYRL